MKKTKKELEQEMIAQMEEALQEQKAAQAQAQAETEQQGFLSCGKIKNGFGLHNLIYSPKLT